MQRLNRTGAKAKLSDVLFFTQVVDRGSFSAAAREVGVPVSTVSRRVARLESSLGTSLLTRTTRRLALTDAGRAYHDHAVRALDELTTAERLVQDLGSSPKGRVRITIPHGVARVLWPAFSEFLERFPDVRLDVEANDRRVDLVEEGYDVAVRTGPLAESTLVARRLYDSAHQLFASPSYIAKHGRLRSLSDLAQHDCVVLSRVSDRTTWSLRQGRKSSRVVVRGRIAVNEMSLVRQAAIDGYGIGKLPSTMVAGDVRARRLERVLRSVDAGPSPVWLVYPARRVLPASVRVLVDHLVVRVPDLLDEAARQGSPP